MSSGQAMVVDTSAAVSVLLSEPGSDRIVAHLESATTRLMSVAGRLELGMVIESRLGPSGADVVSRFVRDAGLELVDVDADIAERALSAWRRFGKGRHPAGLNFGDCFSYALAERTGLPILCTGHDFTATDLEVLDSSE